MCLQVYYFRIYSRILDLSLQRSRQLESESSCWTHKRHWEKPLKTQRKAPQTPQLKVKKPRIVIRDRCMPTIADAFLLPFFKILIVTRSDSDFTNERKLCTVASFFQHEFQNKILIFNDRSTKILIIYAKFVSKNILPGTRNNLFSCKATNWNFWHRNFICVKCVQETERSLDILFLC